MLITYLDQLTMACAERGLQLPGVMADIGIAPSTYWRWCKGLSEPRTGVARKVMAAIAQTDAAASDQAPTS